MEQGERFRALENAAMESAAQGLKALLLLNGGACIAILALVGNLATAEHVQPEFKPLVTVATRSLIWLASGAGLAVLAYIIAYWTNQSYANHLADPTKTRWTEGRRLNGVGNVIAVLSLGCFGKAVLNIAFSLP